MGTPTKASIETGTCGGALVEDKSPGGFRQHPGKNGGTRKKGSGKWLERPGARQLWGRKKDHNRAPERKRGEKRYRFLGGGMKKVVGSARIMKNGAASVSKKTGGKARQTSLGEKKTLHQV